MAATLQIIVDLQNNASSQLKGLRSDVEGLGTGAEKAAGGFNSLQAAGAVAATALVGGIVAAGAAFVSFATDSVRLAADMEAQVSNIAAVWNTTADAISPVKDLIQDLALDPNLKVSAVEAALAIENLAKNGLTMEAVLGGAAHATVLLANATGADFGVAANIATDAMALFNISASNMSEAVNGITSVTVASKFGIEDYALALAQGGGVAAQVGVSFQDFNTTIAAISPFFKSGSDAGTSFKTFLQRLIPTTESASDMMRQLGIVTEDGSNRFFDAQGNMQSMAVIAGVLHETIGPLNDAQKNLALTTIFGSDAMRAAGAIAGFTKEEFEALAQVMGDTDALEQAKTRIDNLKGSWEIFSGVVEALKLQFGSALLPLLKMVVDFMTSQLASAGLAVMGIFENVAESFTMFFEALSEGRDPIQALGGLVQQLALNFGLSMGQATSLGAAVVNLVSFISEAVSKFTSFISQFVSWKDVLIAVGIAIASFVIPIILSIASGLLSLLAPVAAVIAVVAVLRNIWESNFLGIRTAVESFITTVYNLIGAISSALSGDLTGFLSFFDRLPASIQAIIPGILSFIQTVSNLANYFRIVVQDGDYLNDFLSNLPGPIQGIVSAIGQFLAPTFDRLREVISGFRESLTPVGESLQGLGQALGNLWSAIQPVVAVIGGALAGAFIFLGKVIGEYLANWLANIPGMISGLVTAVSGFVDVITSGITGLVNFVKAILQGDWAGAWEAAKTALAGAVDGIQTILSGIGQYLDSFAATIWNTIVNVANDLLGTALPSWETFRDKVVETVAGIATGITERAGDFIAAVQNVIDTIKGAFEGETSWGEVGSAIVAAIGEGIRFAANLIADAFGAVKEAIFTWAGAEDWAGVADTIAGKIGEFLAQAGDAISGQLSEWQAAIFDWAGAEDWAGVADFIAGEIGDFLGAAADLVTGALSEWQAAIFDWAGAEDWEGVAETIAEMIGDALADLGDLVSGQLSEWQAAIFDWAGAEDWAGVAEVVAGLIGEALGSFVDLVVSGLSEWYQGFVDWVGSVDWVAIGQAIVETVILGLLEFVSNVGSALAEWYQAVADYIDGIDWYQIGYDIAYFVVDGLAEFVSAVGETLGEWYTAVSDFLSGIDWAAIGTSIVEWIVTGLTNISTFLTVTLPGWLSQFQTVVNTLGWDGIALAIIGFIFTKLSEVKEQASTAAGSWVAELKAAVQAKIGELIQIGSDIIGGIVAGIQAAAGAIGAALSGIAGGAVAAGQQAFQEHSPSRLFIPIGEGVTEGIAVGVLAAEGSLAAAINQLAGSIETEGLKAFGEAMTALAEGLAAGMNAILDLSFFNLPQGNLVESFQSIADMMRQLVAAVITANVFAVDTLKELDLFLKVVDQISDLIAPIITAMSQINEFGAMHLDFFHEGVAHLGYTILIVLNELVRVNSYGLEVLERMKVFADTVGAIADMIGPVVAGFIQLNAFGAMNLDFFHEGLAHLGYTILLVAGQVETLAVYGLQTMERMKVFADTVGAIADMIGPTIAGFIQLNAFGAMNLDFFHEGLAHLGYTILIVVNKLIEINTYGDYALQHLKTFVDTVGAIADMIDPLISGLISIGGLGAWVNDIALQVVYFRNGIATLVYYLADAAETFSAGTLQHVQAFSDAAGDVIDLIVPAVEGLTVLAGVSNTIAYVALQAAFLRNGLVALVYYLAEGAETFSAGTLQNVQAFADTAKKVIDLIVPAVEGLTYLSTVSNTIAYVALQAAFLRNGLVTLVYYMADAASLFAGAMLQHVQLFVETAGDILDLIKDGVEALTLLAGYVQASGLTVAAGGFAADLTTVILVMVTAIQAAGLLANQAVVEAAELSDGLSDILGVIEDGVDSLTALAAYVQVTGLVGIVQGFAADLALTITTVVNGLQAAGVLSNAAVVAAGELAKKIGDILDVVGDGVDAIASLSEYVAGGVSQASANAFAADLALIIITLVNGLQAAGVLASQALIQAGEVSGQLKDLLDVITPGVEAIAAVAAYTSGANLQEKATQFTQDLITVATTLATGLASSNLALSGALDQAAAISEKLTQLLEVIKPGVEALTAIADYTSKANLQEKATQFTQDLITLSTVLVSGLTQAANSLGGEAISAASAFANAVVDIAQAVTNAVDMLTQLAGSPTPDVTPIMNYVTESAQTIATAATAAGSIGSSVGYVVAFRDAVQQVVEEVLAAIESLGRLAGANTPGSLQAILDQMVNSLKNSVPSFNGAGQAIAEAVIDGINSGDYEGAGKDAVGSLIGGVESMRGAAEGGIQNLIGSVLQAGVAAAKAFAAIGQEMIAQMIAGVNSQQAQLVSTVARVFSDAINSARSVAREAYTVAQDIGREGVAGILSMRSALDAAGASAGQAIVDGLIRAIRNGQSSVVNAIKAMLQAAVNAAQQALGISSPSKVFAEMGQLIMAGLEAGIGQGTKRAISQVRSSIKDINAAARLQASAVPLNFVSGSGLALAGAGGLGPVTLPPISGSSSNLSTGPVINDVQVNVTIAGSHNMTPADVTQAVKKAVDQAMLESGRRADASRRMR